MEFIFVSDILTEIRSYHKTTEQHLRETIFASTPDYIELTYDYPYYYLGIRAVDIISDSFYYDHPHLYRFYVDIRFFNFLFLMTMI